MARNQTIKSTRWPLAVLHLIPTGAMSVSIPDNIARVEDRIAAACQRSGRRREDLKLVAVSKNQPAESVRAAYRVGLRDFGENRVQEATAKRAALADLDVRWHMLGHLQSNKARPARELFQWVHSVDSLRLAEKLALATKPAEAPLAILIEVNLAEEISKNGIRAGEVLTLAEQIALLPAVELRGLMVIPPFFECPDDVRPYFRQLRNLASKIASPELPEVSMRELSMGMSNDFEVAIEEGATIIRVGTAIFGERA